MACAFFRTSCKIEILMKMICTIYYKNWIFSGKKLKLQSTYLPRGISAGLTKLGPFLHANAVFFTDTVVHTVLVGCKCPFTGQIEFKLPPLLAHRLKNFLLCPTIRSFRDFKFCLTNNKLGFIISKLKFLATKQNQRRKQTYLNILPYYHLRD